MGGDSLSVPILYEANATDFNNLGLGPLVDTTVATVTEERNGQFILEMQYPVDGIRASLIAKNRILKVDAGHKLKDQRFVIKRINRIMGNDGLSYSIYAEHISYITADYALKPNLTVSGSGNVAMTQWLNGIIDSNRIHVDSDITTENTTSWTIDKVQNARQALGGVQGSILDIWGGEYRFDNLNISLLRHRGTVSNTLLSYGRNITDFDQEENITNTYTSIYPFASYSVQNGDASEQKILTIPDLVVDSEYVKNFPNRKIQVVDFSDKFSTDEKPTVERLAELAKSYIKSNKVGVPTISTKISFVDLSKTENYKEFAPLEELDLCDEVPFAFEKFGIKTTAKISRIVWNVLLDSYDSLELGELKTNLSDVINNTNNAALDAKDAANDAKNSANNAALSANGKNRNWYGADDPAFGHLSELREGDSWYMPNGEDTELYHWINGQWVFILSTKDAHDAADAADKAQKEAEEAKKTANESVAAANDAVAKAGFANDTATQAKSDAAAAGQQAKDALTGAKKALTDSATAIKDAADSLTSAKDAINKVGNLTTSVTSQFTTVDNELKSKVNQTDYDKLKGTVTSQQTDISQNANSIKLKADKSYADTINNSVVKNTSSVGLLNDQIALTVSKTELNNTLSSYATQTWAQSQIKTTADSINLSVSKVQSNLDNLSIGARNYLADTGSPWQTQGYGVANQVSLNKWLFTFGTINQAPFKDGEYVTVSFDYTSVGTGAYGTISPKFNDTPWGQFGDTEAMKDNGHVVRTVQWQSVWTTSGAATGIQIRMDNVATTRTVTVYNMQFERGNKDTDWEQAPEDMATVDWTKSQLDITDKKITAGITTVTNTLNNNIASATAGMATTTWTNSQITAAKQAISLDVEQSITTATAGMATQTWTQGQIKTTADNINLNVSKVQTDLDGTKTQFSALEVKVNGIQTTVSGKADQSQVTQMAGQITSLIGSANNPNLIPNSGLPKDTLFWRTNDTTRFKVATHSFYTKGSLFALLAPQGTAERTAGTATVSVTRGATYTASLGVFGGSNVVGCDVLWIGRKHGENTDTEVLVLAGNFKPSPSKIEFKSWAFNVGDCDEGYIRVDNNGSTSNESTLFFAEVKLEKGGRYTPWEQTAELSEIVQTREMINLRVQKGDVVNQINISPEGILIDGQKVHITGQTTIDNAVIKDAMIADIKADKITAGTLNAANVNVINLNANNITTGTLKGANLSMNLNTGEVVFQKGYITSADGKIRFDLDKSYFRSLDYNDDGFELSGGALYVFNKGWNGVFGGTEKYLAGTISGGQTLIWSGLDVQGTDGLQMAVYNPVTYKMGARISLGKSGGSGQDTEAIDVDGGKISITNRGNFTINNYDGELGIASPQISLISGKQLTITGGLDVMGKKNAIHPTNDGIRETPAYETAESYLGDIGEGVTDESGRALIRIDALFNQIINTDYAYQVFISSYSNAIIWVEERNAISFEVHSNIPNAKFAWEIKAKRRGYETDRLVKSEMKYEQLNKFHEKKVTA